MDPPEGVLSVADAADAELLISLYKLLGAEHFDATKVVAQLLE
jgi:hypothetical protein